MAGMNTDSKSDAGRARVAAVQMVSGIRVEDNLAAARELIAEAAQQGAGLVVLPEYFCLMGQRDRDKVAVRETDGAGPIQDFLADQAAQHGIWLVGGTLPLAAPQESQVFNSVLVYDPQGRRAARYDKIHLFSFRQGDEAYDEARTIAPGRAPVAFDCALGGTTIKVGLSVCYDLRFPELYRRLSGADLIVVPAAFTATTGKAHWETLLKARAIENLCYVLASAQGGHHENGRATFGHSMLVDPWGEMVDVCATGAGVVVGDLDPGRIAACRASLPALAHRVLA
jgi:predicted amidohydrolase